MAHTKSIIPTSELHIENESEYGVGCTQTKVVDANDVTLCCCLACCCGGGGADNMVEEEIIL